MPIMPAVSLPMPYADSLYALYMTDLYDSIIMPYDLCYAALYV